jgi:phosphoserine aminotransferase
MPVISVSHRSKEWEAVMDECRALWKELLNIPDNYEVLFLGGGASLQFLCVAMNLLENKAGYLETGVWAKKAFKEAKGIGNAVCIASSADKTFSYIPKGYEIPADLDYFHITTNNTIYGTEIRHDMDCPVNLVADMSSDIMSRPVDVSKYAIIYGGAQKNVGPAGVAFVIVRKDVLGKVSRYLPTMLDYRTHIDGGSMFNTPPVFPIFVMTETLKWVKSIGGLEAMNKINVEKANLLYNEIDRNSLFVGTAAKEDRSIMNVCFVMAEGYESLQDEFMAFAKERGMVGIKGHRSVGGFRASIYNACPKEAVQALVDCMKEFEKIHKK